MGCDNFVNILRTTELYSLVGCGLSLSEAVISKNLWSHPHGPTSTHIAHTSPQQVAIPYIPDPNFLSCRCLGSPTAVLSRLESNLPIAPPYVSSSSGFRAILLREKSDGLPLHTLNRIPVLPPRPSPASFPAPRLITGFEALCMYSCLGTFACAIPSAWMLFPTHSPPPQQSHRSQAHFIQVSL